MTSVTSCCRGVAQAPSCTCSVSSLEKSSSSWSLLSKTFGTQSRGRWAGRIRVYCSRDADGERGGGGGGEDDAGGCLLLAAELLCTGNKSAQDRRVGSRQGAPYSAREAREMSLWVPSAGKKARAARVLEEKRGMMGNWTPSSWVLTNGGGGARQTSAALGVWRWAIAGLRSTNTLTQRHMHY